MYGASFSGAITTRCQHTIPVGDGAVEPEPAVLLLADPVRALVAGTMPIGQLEPAHDEGYSPPGPPAHSLADDELAAGPWHDLGRNSSAIHRGGRRRGRSGFPVRRGRRRGWRWFAFFAVPSGGEIPIATHRDFDCRNVSRVRAAFFRSVYPPYIFLCQYCIVEGEVRWI